MMTPTRLAPRTHRGFTIIELLIAVMVLGIGLLSLAGTSGRIASLAGQGRRSGMAATAGFQRLEQLRARACMTRTAGNESVMSGNVLVSKNEWKFFDRTLNGNAAYRIELVVTYLARPGVTRVDTLDQEVSCRR